MSVLHIVNKSPFANNSLNDCLQHLAADDELLLIEDAVVAALSDSRFLAELPAKRTYALQADIEARALSNKLDRTISRIDDEGFVDLTEQHNSSISWY
jgi:tRNA 2-thiouridine synthesizing protein B